MDNVRPPNAMELANFARMKAEMQRLAELDAQKQQAWRNTEQGAGQPLTLPTLPGKAKGGLASLLRKHAQSVPNELEAIRRMGHGHRIFVAHEQDELPREIQHVHELEGYAPDQIYTLAPHHKAHGGKVTHAHHLEIEERPL